MNSNNLQDILDLHKIWLESNREKGQRADLTCANLTGADLTEIKEDFLSILSSAHNEIPDLIKALKNGKVDGSTYKGECACLVGTIANARHMYYEELEGIEPDADRPAESFFTAIAKGDTPKTNPVSKIVLQWAEDYLEEVGGVA